MTPTGRDYLVHSSSLTYEPPAFSTAHGFPIIDEERCYLTRMCEEGLLIKVAYTIDRRTYFHDLIRLQSELIKLQDWVAHAHVAHGNTRSDVDAQ